MPPFGWRKHPDGKPKPEKAKATIATSQTEIVTHHTINQPVSVNASEQSQPNVAGDSKRKRRKADTEQPVRQFRFQPLDAIQTSSFPPESDVEIQSERAQRYTANSFNSELVNNVLVSLIQAPPQSSINTSTVAASNTSTVTAAALLFTSSLSNSQAAASQSSSQSITTAAQAAAQFMSSLETTSQSSTSSSYLPPRAAPAQSTNGSLHVTPRSSSSRSSSNSSRAHVDNSRAAYSWAFKADVVKAVDAGATHESVAKLHNIDASLVSKWMKKKIDVLQKAANVVTAEQKKQGTPDLPAVFELALVHWYHFMKSQTPPAPVNHSTISVKAMELRDEILRRATPNTDPKLLAMLRNFKFSPGWVERFMQRAGLASVRLHGEGASAPMELVHLGRIELKQLLSQFDPADVFNCDEFALFYELLPSVTLEMIGSAVKGRKISKKRLTGLLCANSTATIKLKPMVIGKAAKPRAFKSINIKLLACEYQSTAKAWMTGALFNQFVVNFNEQVKKLCHGRKVILLCDGVSSHKSGAMMAELSHVVVWVFPPNCTSHLQPLDAGIIRSLKANYRRRLIKRMLNWYEANCTKMPDGSYRVTTPYRQPNLLEVIDMLSRAWNDVTKKTIVNCWKKCDIFPPHSSFNDHVDFAEDSSISDAMQLLTDSLSELAVRTGTSVQTSAEALVSADENEPIEPDCSESVFTDLLCQNLIGEEDADSDDEVVELTPQSEPTVPSTGADVVREVEALAQLIQRRQTDSPHLLKSLGNLLDALSEVRDAEEKLFNKKARQQSITEHFPKQSTGNQRITSFFQRSTSSSSTQPLRVDTDTVMLDD